MSKNLKLQIRQLDASDAGFDSQLKSLLAWESVANDKVTATVARILADIKDRGDQALLEHTQQFDQLSASSVAELEISKAEQQQTLQRINAEDRDALEQAADRIRRYHQKQKQESWSYVEADGTLLGQQIRALDRVGIYVPGGKAAYPSSVLMNAIPARVAGVDEI
ncbi:MAG TPA: histidinol dehydrogenase, partial [Pseudomonadales bacterium]